jgi:hypothetical protein
MTRKDLQLAACSMAMAYLNFSDSKSVLINGIMYEGEAKQELIDLLYTEGKCLKAEIEAEKAAKIN